MSLAIPDTGMVVISDVGRSDDNYPRNKQDVGRRLANWALAHTYGKDGTPFSGPLYREMQVEGDRIRVHFDFADNGLRCKGESLSR